MHRFLYHIILFFTTSLMTIQVSAQQDFIYGEIGDEEETGHCEGLIGANIYWLGTDIGTTSGDEGSFALTRIPESTQLVISYRISVRRRIHYR